MPKQRDVKPWTVYPPTQEDREIIERKAAEAALSVSAYLCMVGKLACINVGLSKEHQGHKVLSVAMPAQKKPQYTLHNSWGKLLSPEEAAFVEQERACGRVSLVSEADDGSGYQQYICTETGFLFEIRPTKG